MSETVGAAEVDEDAEVGDGGDVALADLAFLELLDDPLLLLAAPFGHGGALGEDGAVLAAVELDDLEPHFLAHEGGEGVGGIGIIAADAVDLGEGNEGVDALDVRQDAATVVADDLGGEGLAGLEPGSEDIPAFFAAGAIEGDDAVPLGTHRLEDHHADRVAGLQAALALGAHGEHLALGNDGLCLGADIDDDAIGRGAHDDATDDLAATEAPGLGSFGFEKGGHVHLSARFGPSGSGRREGGLPRPRPGQVRGWLGDRRRRRPRGQGSRR